MSLTTSLPWWTKPTGGEPPVEPNGSAEAAPAVAVEPVGPPPVEAPAARYTCPHCGKGYAVQNALGPHQRACAQNPNRMAPPPPWRCPRCRVRFKQVGRHRAACPGPPRVVLGAAKPPVPTPPVVAPMTVTAAMAALQTAIGKQAAELDAMRTQLRRILQTASGKGA